MAKKENIPNLLTLIRILLIPVFLLLTSVTSSVTWHIIAAIIFAVVSGKLLLILVNSQIRLLIKC